VTGPVSEDVYEWARQFVGMRCDHTERTDVARGPRGYQPIVEVCRVCGDERGTARVLVER
jgi:hypothetical protein